MHPPSRPHWSTIEVGGHACEMFAPPDPVPGRALIFLHDAAGGGLEELHALRDLVETARIPTLGPRAGGTWWLDRIVPGFDARVTPERFVVDAVRGEAGRRWGVQPPGIALVGVGMGGQGALRLAYRHPAVFPVAAAIAPAIDFHAAMRDSHVRDDGAGYDALWEVYGDVERARQDTAILHVHPLNWPRHQCFTSDPDDADWHDGAVRLHSKLTALGIPHVAVLEPPGGRATPHVDRVAADVMRFLLDALDAESRRSA